LRHAILKGQTRRIDGCFIIPACSGIYTGLLVEGCGSLHSLCVVSTDIEAFLGAAVDDFHRRRFSAPVGGCL
jgi:hypothetical protein